MLVAFALMSSCAWKIDTSEDPSELLDHYKVGEEMYDEFYNARIIGETSLWDTMTRKKP